GVPVVRRLRVLDFRLQLWLGLAPEPLQIARRGGGQRARDPEHDHPLEGERRRLTALRLCQQDPQIKERAGLPLRLIREPPRWLTPASGESHAVPPLACPARVRPVGGERVAGGPVVHPALQVPGAAPPRPPFVPLVLIAEPVERRLQLLAQE